MKAILNHKITDWDAIRLSPDNRAFKYGDGFFETISIVNGVPRLLKNHINRLRKGAALLKLDVHTMLNLGNIRKSIHALQETNDILGNAKLRLSIWRNTSGLYTPADGQAQMLMTIESLIIQKVSIIQNAGFSDIIINYPSPYSSFKTLSALKYVLAGIEKKNHHFDDIILFDYRGYVSETLNSNIFWKKNCTYFTPPLSTGCVAGIMRNWLMDELNMRGFPVEEKLALKDDILEAECIFTTNALGICHVKYIGERSFIMDPISQEIIEGIS